MVALRKALETDCELCLSFDRHIGSAMFLRKAAAGEYYVIENGGIAVGVIRYGFFWDEYPFLNLVFLAENERGKGTGETAMLLWEEEMRRIGCGLVMTSTMAEESAQHFYHRLGYKDSGCLVKSVSPLCENIEIFLIKAL